jgi:hypothetical protein
MMTEITALPFSSQEAEGMRATTAVATKARSGTIRSCGMAIATRHELVSATIAPTTTAVVSAIRIPVGTKPASGPLKIKDAKEAEAIIVNTATTNPALPITATCENAVLLTESSTPFGNFNASRVPLSTPNQTVTRLLQWHFQATVRLIANPGLFKQSAAYLVRQSTLPSS